MNKWMTSLRNAKKTCTRNEKVCKVHYDFDDGSEMLEEYNVDTTVLIRRAWKKPELCLGSNKWVVEIGDPMIDLEEFEQDQIQENNNEPYVTRRITKRILEWRIHNLVFPEETYRVSVDKEQKSIIVRTVNKKYYKVLPVPELERFDLDIEEDCVDFHHKLNMLIVTYKKPQKVKESEEEMFKEVMKLSDTSDSDCNIN